MMDGSISIPENPKRLSTSSSASSFGSIDSSTYSVSPYPVLSAPPPSTKKGSSAASTPVSPEIEIIARPRPRRRLSSVYSTESSYSGSSEVFGTSEEEPKWSGSLGSSFHGDKYSVFNTLRKADSPYKGWSKEVLGLGPYGWSEEILEGGYESTDSAFSNGSEDSLPRTPGNHTLNPFLLNSSSPSPPSVQRNLP